MGLFERIVKQAAAAPPDQGVEFVRSEMSMKQFKGTKRIYVSCHNESNNAEKNAAALLGDKDEHLCVGSEITLTGFRYDDTHRAIKVAVDGKHLGVIWDELDPHFEPTYSGAIEGVYVKVERNAGRPRVFLFVKLPE